MTNPLRTILRGVDTLTRDKSDTLLLVVSCTMVLLPFMAYTPDWINVAAGLVLCWRVWLTFSGQATPQKWLLRLLATLMFGAVYLHFHTWLGKDAGIAFLVILVCLKLLELDSRRDALATVFVCYFLLAGQLLYSQSILSALYLLACAGLTLSAQMSYQYHQLAPPPGQRIAAGFRMVAMALPLALIMFLFFPRLQGPLWGKQQGSSGVSGLSDSMTPGNVAELALSDQIAFRVDFNKFVPRPDQLYWRAIVLDTFDGTKWTESDLTNQSGVPDTAESGGVEVRQDIVLEPNGQHWLLGLDRPTSLATPRAGPVSGPTPESARLTRYGEMRNGDFLQDRTRYTIVSRLADSYRDHDGDARRAALQLPPGFNPVTLQWAGQLREQAHSPAQAVVAVLHYFRTEPFRYTLDPPPLGRDQIDDFLFGTRAGFCEHYASAFVVVMRAMQIPARVVTGYQGGELNPVDHLTTVRQSDAHAWAEVWLDQRGWVRVDPTAAVAPSRIERGLRGALPNRNLRGLLQFNDHSWLGSLSQKLRMQWDATNSAWNLWVLNYNLGKQLDLLTALSGIDHPLASQLGMALIIGMGSIGTVFSLLLLRKKTRVSALDRSYEKFCRNLARRGYARLLHEGPLAYRDRLMLMLPDAQPIAQFLSVYSRCKYGTGYNAAQQAQLQQLLTLCSQLDLPRHTPPR